MASGVAIAMAVQLCSKSKLILQELSDRKTLLSNRQKTVTKTSLIVNKPLSLFLFLIPLKENIENISLSYIQ